MMLIGGSHLSYRKTVGTSLNARILEYMREWRLPLLLLPSREFPGEFQAGSLAGTPYILGLKQAHSSSACDEPAFACRPRSNKSSRVDVCIWTGDADCGRSRPSRKGLEADGLMNLQLGLIEVRKYLTTYCRHVAASACASSERPAVKLAFSHRSAEPL